MRKNNNLREQAFFLFAQGLRGKDVEDRLDFTRQKPETRRITVYRLFKEYQKKYGESVIQATASDVIEAVKTVKSVKQPKAIKTEAQVVDSALEKIAKDDDIAEAVENGVKVIIQLTTNVAVSLNENIEMLTPSEKVYLLDKLAPTIDKVAKLIEVTNAQ